MKVTPKPDDIIQGVGREGFQKKNKCFFSLLYTAAMHGPGTIQQENVFSLKVSKLPL